MDVTLKLKVMGTYSATSPKDCRKSLVIIDQGCSYFKKHGLRGAYDDEGVGKCISALALLATGREELLPMVRAHAHEVDRDETALTELGAKLESFHRLYGIGRHWSAGIKGIKCALSLRGIASDFMADPFHRFGEEQRETVARLLAELGLSQSRQPAFPSSTTTSCAGLGARARTVCCAAAAGATQPQPWT